MPTKDVLIWQQALERLDIDAIESAFRQPKEIRWRIGNHFEQISMRLLEVINTAVSNMTEADRGSFHINLPLFPDVGRHMIEKVGAVCCRLVPRKKQVTDYRQSR